jgi:hypothetical protein
VTWPLSLLLVSRSTKHYTEEQRLSNTSQTKSRGWTQVLRKFFERFTIGTMTLLTATEYLCHKSQHICIACRNHNSVLSQFMTYHRICNKSNTMDATCDTTQKSKDWATRAKLKAGGEHRCSGSVSRTCYTGGIHRVTLIKLFSLVLHAAGRWHSCSIRH